MLTAFDLKELGIPTMLQDQLSVLSGERKFQTILDAQITRTKKLIEAGALIFIVTHPEKDLSERPEFLNFYGRYLSYIKSCDDLWFATPGEIFSHWTRHATGAQPDSDLSRSAAE